MATNGDSSAKKPRKKRKSINYMTAREKLVKKQPGSVNPKPLGASSKLTKKASTFASISTSKTTTKTGNNISTPKSSRARWRDNDKENLSSSQGGGTGLKISTSKKTSAVNSNRNAITKTSQSQAPKSKGPIKLASVHDEVPLHSKETPRNAQSQKKKKRKSINFIAPRDKVRIVHHQSMTGHTLTRGNNADMSTFNGSTSSISRISDAPGPVDSQLQSQSISTVGSIKQLRSKTVSPVASKKRKLPVSKVQQTQPGSQVKKRKTSKVQNKGISPTKSFNTSFSSTTSTTRGQAVKQTSNSGVLDRIKDLKVSKKSFEKWKPISNVTIGFVEDILKSVILTVSAESINLGKGVESTNCFAAIKYKIMERLPNLKAPFTKEDYRKMESQNQLAEDTYAEMSRDLNHLQKKIEEEQKLLDLQTSMVVDFTNKLKNYEEELQSLENEKAHPLIRQTKSVLNLPKLPDDFFIEDETPMAGSEEAKYLCKTLQQLRQNTTDAGLEEWLDKLTIFTQKLHDKGL